MNLDHLLNDLGLWKSLAAAFNAGRCEDWRDLNDLERIRSDAQDNHELSVRLKRVFDDKVISKLSIPAEISSDELSQIAIDQLAGLNLEAASSMADEQLALEHPNLWFGKSRFLAISETHVSDELESDFAPFDLGLWNASRAQLASAPRSLWSAANCDLQIQFQGDSDIPQFLARRDTDTTEPTKIEAYLAGRFSNQALQIAILRLKPIVECAAKTARFSATRGPDDSAGFQFWESTGPSLCYLTSGDGGKVFRTCIDVSLTPTTGNDVLSLVERSMQCLVQADSQSDSENALLKCFAAIESIVCFSTDKLDEQIVSNVPVLLQPHGLGRGQKGKVLKELYKMRCRIAHGTQVGVSADVRDWVRRIASGVVRAVVLWREHQKRIDYPTEIYKLKDDLFHASKDGKGLVQIDADMSQLLPDSIEQEFDPFELPGI